MSTSQEEKLLRRLVELAEPSTAENATEHVAAEDMALFVAGRLPDADRGPLVEHLSACHECRVWAAELLKQEDEQTQVQTVSIPSAHPGWFASPRTWLAAAAALLLAVTAAAIYWPGRSGFTEQTAYLQAKEELVAGRFDDARATLAQAHRQGVASDRLRSLSAQALREIPDPLALAQAGRLSDFGIDIGGVVARDPGNRSYPTGLAAARRELGNQESDDLELLLNRGHLHLSLNELAEAHRDFAAAGEVADDHPSVWLGLGLAAFLGDDYAAAEQAFRKTIEIDPSNLAAQINLAMALQEQDKRDEAIAQWRIVLADNGLGHGERTKIESTLRMLEEP
jgi:tetratricopeptide (TPR) repeat protein